MSIVLDRLIRQYNREVSKSSLASFRHKGKTYPTHKESLDQVLNKIDDVMNLYNEIDFDIKIVEKLEQSNEDAKNLDSVRG
jgi:hypothetical protein